MKIARKNGRVTKRELMAEADVGKMKATETLKTLASKGVLEWVGASTNDPHQYYRPVNINCPLLPTTARQFPNQRAVAAPRASLPQRRRSSTWRLRPTSRT